MSDFDMLAISKLADAHGRQFNYLRLSVTDVCNFRCNYCLPDGYECDKSQAQQPLSLNEIQQLVSLFAQKGIRKIRITGGEPSLRKDLPAIIKCIKQTPGIEKVALTTNGYKLNEKIQSYVDAGLDALNVSIDSLDPQVFQAITGHNRLQEVLNAIEKAQGLGLKNVKVNAVLLKSYNLNQFEHFLNWVKGNNISLRFIELMETGDNKDYFAQNHVSGQMIQKRLLENGWVEKIRSKDSGPAKEYEHPDYQGSLGLIMPYSQDFCKSCNRLRISSQGKLHLCLFGESGYDLRHFLQPDSAATLDNEEYAQLDAYLDHILQIKKQGHDLQHHQTGNTRHLAMLGG